MSKQAKLVRAVYDYDRKHNDELSFRKGDLITITQALDGGWWEGTLNDITAWLPSNYIIEVHDSGEKTYDDLPCEETQRDGQYLVSLQNEIIQHIMEGELKYVSELNNLLHNLVLNLETINNLPFIHKIQRLKEILTKMIPLHQSLLAALDDMKQSPDTKRIGKLFLNLAPSISSLYLDFSSIHLYIVAGLEKYRTFLQSHLESRSVPFNLSKMKQTLSLPFDRLGKYPLLLKEMERYYADPHPDRGDVQRGVEVFTEINENCQTVCKMKERDLDILYASILGWKGERLSQLGDPVYTERVGNASSLSSPEALDHILVVFHGCILLLACTEQVDVYAYKSKISADGLSITLRDETNFELCSGLTGECLCLVCSDGSTRDKVIETINHVAESAQLTPASVPTINPATKHQEAVNNSPAGSVVNTTNMVKHLSGLIQASPSSAAHHPGPVHQHPPGHLSGAHQQQQHMMLQNSGHLPPGMNQNAVHQPATSVHLSAVHAHYPQQQSSSSSTPLPATSVAVMRGPKRQPLVSLRPDPPQLSTNQELARQSGRQRSPGRQGVTRAARKKTEDVARRVEDDALILQVIESYCASTQSKHTSKSLDLAKLRLSDTEIRRGPLRSNTSGSSSQAPPLVPLRDSGSSGSSNDMTAGGLPPPPAPPPGTSSSYQPSHQPPLVGGSLSQHHSTSSSAPCQHFQGGSGPPGSVTASMVPPPVILPTRSARKL